MSKDFLPPNATESERALADVIGDELTIPVPTAKLWSARDCPAGVLPWLAWALSVDAWSEDWTEARKRAAIANAVTVHQRKGTVGAVRRAIEPLGYDVVVDEDTGEIFTFAVRLVTDAANPVTAADQDEAERLALSAKNARSHLAGVASQTNISRALTLGSVALSGEVSTVWPDIADSMEGRSGLVFATALIGAEESDIYPDRGIYAAGEPLVTTPATYATSSLATMTATLTAEGIAA